MCVWDVQIFVTFGFMDRRKVHELVIPLMHHTQVQQRVSKLIDHIDVRTYNSNTIQSNSGKSGNFQI